MASIAKLGKKRILELLMLLYVVRLPRICDTTLMGEQLVTTPVEAGGLLPYSGTIDVKLIILEASLMLSDRVIVLNLLI